MTGRQPHGPCVTHDKKFFFYLTKYYIAARLVGSIEIYRSGLIGSFASTNYYELLVFQKCFDLFSRIKSDVVTMKYQTTTPRCISLPFYLLSPNSRSVAWAWFVGDKTSTHHLNASRRSWISPDFLYKVWPYLSCFGGVKVWGTHLNVILSSSRCSWIIVTYGTNTQWCHCY